MSRAGREPSLRTDEHSQAPLPVSASRPARSREICHDGPIRPRRSASELGPLRHGVRQQAASEAQVWCKKRRYQLGMILASAWHDSPCMAHGGESRSNCLRKDGWGPLGGVARRAATVVVAFGCGPLAAIRAERIRLHIEKQLELLVHFSSGVE